MTGLGALAFVARVSSEGTVSYAVNSGSRRRSMGKPSSKGRQCARATMDALVPFTALSRWRSMRQKPIAHMMVVATSVPAPDRNAEVADLLRGRGVFVHCRPSRVSTREHGIWRGAS